MLRFMDIKVFMRSFVVFVAELYNLLSMLLLTGSEPVLRKISSLFWKIVCVNAA